MYQKHEEPLVYDYELIRNFNEGTLLNENAKDSLKLSFNDPCESYDLFMKFFEFLKIAGPCDHHNALDCLKEILHVNDYFDKDVGTDEESEEMSVDDYKIDIQVCESEIASIKNNLDSFTLEKVEEVNASVDGIYHQIKNSSLNFSELSLFKIKETFSREKLAFIQKALESVKNNAKKEWSKPNLHISDDVNVKK